MTWIALRMLMGDRAKSFCLIFGVSFATLLMTQQVSIFMGILTRTASQVLDVRDAEIWVMDNKVRFIDEAPALPDTDLYRVRGVQGVEWAVRLYKGQVTTRLADGNFRAVVLFGLDDSTLVGAPQEMILGTLADLRGPDAVIVDKAGYEYMWPGQPYELGRVFEITHPRYTSASLFVPPERNLMSFVLAKVEPGVPASVVCRRIHDQTGLMALTQ